MKKEFLRNILAPLLIIISMLVITINLSQARELDDIRAAIKSRGAKWHAEETSISRLSVLERKMRVGLVKPTFAVQQQSETTSAYVLAAPSGTFDWRNNGGNNYVTRVRDQGNCGSCWAFATTGALESYSLIHGPFSMDLNLAEQILISCGGAGSCNGGYVDKASNYIHVTGLPPESYYIYTATNGSCPADTSWMNYTDKILGWKWVATTSPDVATIKNALFTYGPLVTTMQVYSDFFSYRSGVYSYTSGSLQGGHAVLLIGYADDATFPGGGYFIVKNSWGTGWGEPGGTDSGGYFRVAYNQLSSVVKFGDYTIAYDATVPPPPACTYSISPTGKSFTNNGGSGSFSLTAGSTCTWTAKSSVSWISITSASSGTGGKTITYSVSANTSTSSRTGSISIKDGSGTVMCSFSVTQQKKRR